MTAHISRDDLRDAIASGAVTVVDALPESYYAQVHLPEAVNLVEDDVAARAAELLPELDAAIVTYCSNVSCGNSQAVASRLEQLGYTNVRKYREGIQDWVEAGLPTESGLPALSLGRPPRPRVVGTAARDDTRTGGGSGLPACPPGRPAGRHRADQEPCGRTRIPATCRATCSCPMCPSSIRARGCWQRRAVGLLGQ